MRILERGCITFSRYFDSIWWLANQLSQDIPDEIIGSYAGGRRSGLLVATLRTLSEAHVGMGSELLHAIMGIGAAAGTAGTASLLGRWTHFYSQVAAVQQIFC